jgi:hypothetical protein
VPPLRRAQQQIGMNIGIFPNAFACSVTFGGAHLSGVMREYSRADNTFLIAAGEIFVRLLFA